MKFLITTNNQGVEEFNKFKTCPNRLYQYIIKFFKDGLEVYQVTFNDHNVLQKAIESLYYTIATAAPGTLLIDQDKLLKVKTNKDYLGYDIDP